MSLYVIRDRETGAYFQGVRENGNKYAFRASINAHMAQFSDEDEARRGCDRFPFACDVVELRAVYREAHGPEERR